MSHSLEVQPTMESPFRKGRRMKKSWYVWCRNHVWENATMASHLDQRQETPRYWGNDGMGGWPFVQQQQTARSKQTFPAERRPPDRTWVSVRARTKANLSSKKEAEQKSGKKQQTDEETWPWHRPKFDPNLGPHYFSCNEYGHFANACPKKV